ncbi:hypothetical protein [Rahnella variigena]|uniref:hypothetical protein n=1 Tax=Rahnella variigena TaxID=574964 RepID=UPI001F0E4D0C|nr:hypothetical protein [Rahnella variigena]
MKRQSRLDAPVQYWDEDLPKQADAQKAPPQLIRVNEINDVWMEIPRYVNYGWVVQWLSASLSFLAFSCISFLFNSDWHVFRHSIVHFLFSTSSSGFLFCS